MAVFTSGAIMYSGPDGSGRTKNEVNMKYLHTMLRVRNLDDALNFYVDLLGLKEARRRVDEKNKYTLVFLAAPSCSSYITGEILPIIGGYSGG